MDPGDVPTPPVESVVSRVREALRYLQPEKLLLAAAAAELRRTL